MTRGGKRNRAGRPRLDKKTVLRTVAFKVSPQDWERWEAVAALRQTTAAEMLRETIKEKTS